MKEELENALEGLSEKEIEALLEDAKAVKEGKAQGIAEYGDAADEKKRQDALKQLKEVAKASEFMKQAKMPIEFKDDDLGFGEGEYDMRKASPETMVQLNYRFDCMQTNLLRDISQSLVDTQRLLMVCLKKMGVEDIEGAITDLLDDLNQKYGRKA